MAIHCTWQTGSPLLTCMHREQHNTLLKNSVGLGYDIFSSTLYSTTIWFKDMLFKTVVNKREISSRDGGDILPIYSGLIMGTNSQQSWLQYLPTWLLLAREGPVQQHLEQVWELSSVFCSHPSTLPSVSSSGLSQKHLPPRTDAGPCCKLSWLANSGFPEHSASCTAIDFWYANVLGGHDQTESKGYFFLHFSLVLRKAHSCYFV